MLGRWIAFLGLAYGLYAPLPTLLVRSFWRMGQEPLKGIRLTFDDGPCPQLTPRLLELLDEQGERACFFLLGSRLEAYGDLGDLASRHLLGLHGQDHLNFLWTSPWKTWRDLSQAHQALRDRLGGVRYFRAPYGAYNLVVLGFCWLKKLRIIHWDALVGDWKVQKRADLTKKIRIHMNRGDLLVLHDGRAGRADPGAREGMLEALASYFKEEKNEENS